MKRFRQVDIATTDDEKEEIYRLRYLVYIEEMGGGQRHTEADVTKRRLRDHLDDTAVQMYVRQDGMVVGCMRANLGRDGRFECEDLLDLHSFVPWFPRQVAMISRFALHPSLRGSSVVKELSCAMFEFNCDQGIKFLFLDCHPKLIPLYSRLGFRIYRPGFKHPKYTFVVPMVLVMDDIEHFERIRSPLLSVARRYPASKDGHELLLSRFPAAAHTFVSADLNADDFWELLRGNLLGPASTVERCDILTDFTEQETKFVLSLGQIVSCRRGDPVLSTGEEGREIFLILDGSFQVIAAGRSLTESYIVNILIPGDIFGEMAYLTEGYRCSTVVAMEDSNLLILHGKALDKMISSEPPIAAKLFRNLARIVESRSWDMSLSR